MNDIHLFLVFRGGRCYVEWEVHLCTMHPKRVDVTSDETIGSWTHAPSPYPFVKYAGLSLVYVNSVCPLVD